MGLKFNPNARAQEFEKEYLVRAETHRRKIDFTKGIALGLLYGIIGNLFVQFFYPVVEGIILQKYDVLFWSNVESYSLLF